MKGGGMKEERKGGKGGKQDRKKKEKEKQRKKPHRFVTCRGNVMEGWMVTVTDEPLAQPCCECKGWFTPAPR